MATHEGEQAAEAGHLSVDGTLQQKMEATGGLIVNTALVPLLAKHALFDDIPPAPPAAPETRTTPKPPTGEQPLTIRNSDGEAQPVAPLERPELMGDKFLADSKKGLFDDLPDAEKPTPVDLAGLEDAIKGNQLKPVEKPDEPPPQEPAPLSPPDTETEPDSTAKSSEKRPEGGENPLTQGPENANVKPPASGPETITGSNERTGSEMPAEGGSKPLTQPITLGICLMN
jgi:hypothetical protein